MRSGALLLLFVVVSVVSIPTSDVFADTPSGVGLAAIQVPDPINQGKMDGFVFYPSSRPGQGATRIGPYEVAATFDLPAQPRAHPLVLISHGNGGSRLDLHHLATHLASHGFVVATLDHPKDDYRDSSGAGHPEVLSGRPIQVSAVIDHLLHDARFAALIDPARIGVAGFSAGGYTSLMLVGAVPRFDRIVGYCLRHPDDPVFCAAPELKNDTATRTDPAVQKRLDELNAGLSRWGRIADPRVKAAFAMAPLSLFFDAAGAAAIDRPVFLSYGEDDHLLLPSENALHIKPFMKTLAGTRAIARADHFVFLAPCSAELAKAVPIICTDPPGVDRAKVAVQVEADALAFFTKTLGGARR